MGPFLIAPAPLYNSQGDPNVLCDCNNTTHRRSLLKAGLGLGLTSLLHGQENPAAARPKEGDFLVRVGDTAGTPLTPADIPAATKQIIGWAMDPADKTQRSASRLNRVLLVRVDPEKLSAETKSRAADGIVAYSAICSHAGCDVTDWMPDDQTLFCSCHSSKFDPRDGAKVLEGPATHPLPALPLKIADGKLVVAKPFTARITFEQG
jgi:rieske iron-sulfur protein